MRFLTITISFFVHACIDDVSQDKNRTNNSPEQYLFTDLQGEIKISSEGKTEKPYAVTFTIAKGNLQETTNGIWQSEPLKFDKIHFDFTVTQNTYYLCDLQNKNITHANFLTTNDCRTDEDISWLSTYMFGDCGTIKRVDDGKIATSVDGQLRRGDDYGMKNVEGENLNKFKGYVYQMKAECNSTDRTVAFVVTTKALPYLKKYKFMCKSALDYKGTYLWKIHNEPSDLALEADCSDTLAIFDSDDNGRTMKLYTEGAFETDVPAKKPEGELYMRSKGQLYVWPKDGVLTHDATSNTKIEFLPNVVSFYAE